MKVIFLDIDGVLNSQETFRKKYQLYKKTGKLSLEIDNEMLENLQKVVTETSAKVVLTSCWRNHFINLKNNIVAKTEKGSRLLKLFEDYNINVYDLTPYKNANRETEILMWLDNYNPESFAIIDNDYSYFDELLPYVIKTNSTGDYDLGLTYNKACESIKLLNENILKRVK